MDMEHLTKTQIVLLTLLVSFFTSIATGIVTVSLMDQAPPVVAQTVNRVIERTVETVSAAPQTASKTQPAAATVITQEKTVVVNESDQIAKAVDRVSASLVRVYTTGPESAFLGMGFVLDGSGTIVTDSAALDERADATLALPDGSRLRAFVVKRDDVNNLAFLKVATSTAEGAEQKAPQWKPVGIASERPVLGTSVVALSGKTVARIGTGVVTAIMNSEAGPIIDTNIAASSILPGSLLIDTGGNVVGVSTGTSRASSDQGFTTAQALLPSPTGPKTP
jgi:S1-C subfamily serine protease